MPILSFLNTQKRVIEQEVDEAVVDNIRRPGKEWRVYFDGTYWTARSKVSDSFLPGDIVKVTGRNKLKLYIEPLTL